MGFLSSRNDPAIDPALEASIVFDESLGRNEVLRLVAQNQSSIQATIEVGENVLGVVAYSKLGTSYVLVITDRRVLNLKKGKLHGSLDRRDVGRTRIFNLPRNNGRYLVAIQTHDGMLYADDDPARLEPGRWMSVASDDPKIPQRVSAIIDEFYGLSYLG